MMGACDKGIQAAYERNHHPPEKVHQPWIDDCMAQMTNALAVIDAMIEPGASCVLLGQITQADVAAFVAERFARALGVDTGTEMPRLRNLTKRLAETPPFAHRAITYHLPVLLAAMQGLMQPCQSGNRRW